MTCPYCHRTMHGAEESGRCTNPGCRHAETLGHEYVAVKEAPAQVEAERERATTTSAGGGESITITGRSSSLNE